MIIKRKWDFEFMINLNIPKITLRKIKSITLSLFNIDLTAT